MKEQEMNSERMTINQAKEIDIVGYLAAIHIHPAKVRGNDHWYLSPLPDHQEKTPSFKVNAKLNRWYDHGLGKGGNLVDLGILIHQCSVSVFLKMLKTGHTLLPVVPSVPYRQLEQEQEEHHIQVIGATPLHSGALIRYLQSRRIPFDIAARHTQEVTYEFKGHQYYAVGFKNNSGGYELRSQGYKLSSTPKDITLIQNGSKQIGVFEGFTDFLSFLTIKNVSYRPPLDYLVLNSTSFIEKALPVIQSYDHVFSFLDNDPTGQKCSALLSKHHARHRSLSSWYRGYNDMNEWLVKASQDKNLRRGQKLR